MKRVKGFIYVRALGEHNFEFYVPDDTTHEEIEKMVNEACDYDIAYNIEDGYEEYTEVRYRKKREYDYDNWLSTI